MKLFFLIFLLFSSITFASSDEIWNRPDWSRDVFVNRGENRENIYQLSDEKFKEFVKNGKLHALVYPVDVSGIFIPYKPMTRFMDDPEKILSYLSMKGLAMPQIKGHGAGTLLMNFINGSGFTHTRRKMKFKYLKFLSLVIKDLTTEWGPRYLQMKKE